MLVSQIIRLFDGAQCQIDPEYTDNATSSNSKTLVAIYQTTRHHIPKEPQIQHAKFKYRLAKESGSCNRTGSALCLEHTCTVTKGFAIRSLFFKQLSITTRFQ